MTRRLRTVAAVGALAVGLGACGAQGLSKKDVVDGLVQRHFTQQQAQCIADAIFTTYTGARRQKLVDELNGGSVSASDQQQLTRIVDACLPT